MTPEYIDQRIQDFETSPESRLLLSGYGSAVYENVERGPDGFGAMFNPSWHFRMTESLHFNGELELHLAREDAETVTDIELEFGEIDFLATDWLILSGGKFLTPFNAFGPRQHPAWINKMASLPPIYGGHGTVGMIPILSQIGAEASGGTSLWNDEAKVNYALYVVNAPTIEEEEGEEPELPSDLEFENFPNMDSNFAVGGRVGFLPIANLEIGASYQTADMPLPNNRYHLAGADAVYQFRGFETRGEYVFLSRGAEGGDRVNEHGYYVQSSYRLRDLVKETSGWLGLVGRIEPVVRWGQTTNFAPHKRNQLALGLDFWLFDSAPLKLTYEINRKAVRDDRFIIQFAYGF